MDRAVIEKRARICEISAKYVSIPCFIISAIAAGYGFVSNDQELMILNIVISCFNILCYYINTQARSLMLEALQAIDDSERLQKVKDLKPNR